MGTIKGGRRVMRTMGRNREGWELLKGGEEGYANYGKEQGGDENY